MNEAFNENALLGLPVLSPDRAAFLRHVARHEAALIAAGYFPQEPKPITTPYGVGYIGPSDQSGVRAMLKGTKPLLFLNSGNDKQKMEMRALLPIVESGILGVLTYNKEARHHATGIPCQVVYAIFFQPDQEAAAHELRTILSIDNNNGFTSAEHTRIGQLLGYSRADIAAFHINLARLTVKNRLKRTLGL